MTKYRNTIVKIVCLLTAFFLWGYVINEVDPVVTRTFSNVPVELKNMSYLREQGLQLMNTDPDPIEVTVEGHRKALNAISIHDLQATIDLNGISGGTQPASIHVGIVSGDAQVKEYTPQSITLEVEPVVSKTFSVEARTFGNLPDGYILGNIQENTKEVTLRGPERVIDSISVVVANVNVGNKMETSIINAPIQALDSDLKPVENVVFEPAAAEVQVTITKTKTIPIELVLDDPERPGLQQNRVNLNPNTVSITGDAGVIDAITSIKTQPVSSKELMENRAIPVTLMLPEGSRLVNTEDTFIVRYEPQDVVTKDYELHVTTVWNEQEEESKMIPKNMPEKLQLRLSGEEGVLKSITDQDLKVILKDDGSIEVHPPNGVTVASVYPSKINTSAP